MEPGLLTLIIITVVLLASMITLLVVAAVQNGNSTKPSESHPCSETINIGSLIQVSDKNVISCQYNKELGTLYYIGDADPTLDFVVAPWPTDPSHVCAQYCNPAPENGVCTGPSYQGKTAQENYDNCISTLITKYENHCFPPAPIAAKGITPYYAYSVTKASCVT